MHVNAVVTKEKLEILPMMKQLMQRTPIHCRGTRLQNYLGQTITVA